MNKNLKRFIIIALTTGTVTITGALSVFADSNNQSINSGNTTTKTEDHKRGGRFNKSMDFSFSELVTKGIVDQSTADKMTTFMTQFKGNMKAEMDKVKGMSDEDKKAYFQNKQGDKLDPITQMVNANIITQAQADAIKALKPEHAEKAGFRNFDVNSLVTKGVIDQGTADKITAYVTKLQEDRKAEMDKINGMSDADKKAYFENMKSKKGNDKETILSKMVADGVITQTQADAIKAAVEADRTTKTNKNTTNTSNNTAA